MRFKLLIAILTFFFFIQLAFAQDDAAAGLLGTKEDEQSEENTDDFTLPTDLERVPTTFLTNSLGGNLGYLNIGNENYIGLRLNPEIDLGKVGIGLDIPLWFNLSTGKFRSEVYKSGVGVLRLVDYLRLGRKKQTNFYLKVGTLQGERLGYGFLLDNYTNSRSYERRKVGVSLDILIKDIFGLEAIYSDFNFNSLNLLALRPYIRPLGRSDIPVLKTLEVGFSFIQDKDNTGEVINDTIIRPQYIKDGVQAIGLDLGVTFLNTSLIKLVAYGQYGRLKRVESETLQADFPDLYPNYESGNGFAIGAKASINLILNVLNAHIRIERLFYSQNFIPQFFNTVYEIDKDAQVISLLNSQRKQGIYGSLYFKILNFITGGGSLVLPDDVTPEEPAFFRLNANIDNIGKKIVLNALYTKGNITTLSDAVKLDENSLLRVRAAYRFHKFLVAGIDYYWTFASQDNGSFETTNFVYPYIGLSIPLKKNDD